MGAGPYNYDSNPWLEDSDYDGLTDKEEISGNYGMGYTDPENEDTDYDDFSDYLEWRLKWYGETDNNLQSSDSNIIFKYMGLNGGLSYLSAQKPGDSYEYSPYYTTSVIYSIGYEDNYNVYYRRDKSYDFVMGLKINGYGKPSVLNFENTIDGIGIKYVSKVNREDGTLHINDLRIGFWLDDDYYCGEQTIKSGECSYNYWYSGTKYFTSSTIICKTSSGKYANDIRVAFSVDGTYRKRNSYLYLDNFEIWYYFAHDL